MRDSQGMSIVGLECRGPPEASRRSNSVVVYVLLCSIARDMMDSGAAMGRVCRFGWLALLCLGRQVNHVPSYGVLATR